MARGKKKDTAPAPEATETTTAPQEGQEGQEGHLDPGQFQDMDDATLQGLAQDLGLDPAAYEDRDSLIAAIAAEPLTMDPPEPEASAPALEPEPEPEQQQDPAPEPVPVTERPLPCKAEVAASIAVLRRAVIGTAEMVRPVATLDKGTAVTVIAFEGDYARLANGLYVKTTLLA